MSTKILKVVTDGSLTRSKGCHPVWQSGILILDQDNIVQKYLTLIGKGNFWLTSNAVEYNSVYWGVHTATQLIRSLGTLSKCKDYQIHLYADSQLIVQQLRKVYATKKQQFLKIQKDILKYCRYYKEIHMYWHRRNTDLAVIADYASKADENDVRALFLKYGGLDVDLLSQEIHKKLLLEEMEQTQSK